MATMRMYCPSLKKNVEATITDGKRVASKGGSLRNIIYGEYEGRKCLPKTVKETVFAQHGFGAESEGESATYEPSQEPEGSTPATEPTNASFSAECINCGEGHVSGRFANFECNGCGYEVCDRCEADGAECVVCEERMCVGCVETGFPTDWDKSKIPYDEKDVCFKCISDVVGDIVYEKELFCSSCGSHKRAEGCGCMAAESNFEASVRGSQYSCADCGADMGFYEQGEDPLDVNFVLAEDGEKEVCNECYLKYEEEDFETESFCSSCGSHKRAEGCGCKSAETFEAEKSTCRCGKDIANPKCKMCGSSICSDCDWQYANKCIECFGSHFNAESSPSSFDISWEDAQGVSSPSLPPEGVHFAEQGKNIKFCNGCNKRTNFEDGECNFCAFPEFGAEGDYHLNGETCEHCAEEVQLNAEGFCSECYEDLYLSETMAAEGISRNGKLVLGLTALGVGMAMALGSERIASLLDKLNRK